ncbi:siderophore-iron transporter Str1 [Kwoniella heveanensis BCC8398]|uniref:Siderophore-iron transporter Str1 n=1 Tax=Kwoniella heveanensis BCC8398 TaxID=1296120 RepID=A0A1B9GKE9_9TREE|nr:siderophore-iron transporter Str1 [Kwoniella heveanensis BCC8398]
MATRPSLEVPTLEQRPGFDRQPSDLTHKDDDKHIRHPEDGVNADADHERPSAPSTLHEKDKAEEIEKARGVAKIEALYLVFGKGLKLWILWGAIALVAFTYGLSQMTTYYYTPFATSAFGEHTIVGTIGTITAIMAGVSKPFIAKLADLFSRPFALAVAVLCYTLGYIIVASAQNVNSVVGGQVIYTLGNTGIDFVSSILLADITSLQWRGLVNGLYAIPYIPFAFIAGYIADGINAYSADGWRWGFGMFCIIVPCTIIPAILILFWADYRAKKVGALSLASSTYAREAALSGQTERRTVLQMLIKYAREIDAIGLLLIGFAFGCLLTPFTLYTTAKGGYTNPSLIALLVVGGVLFIATCVWEFRYASHPIMPLRIWNKTFICCVGIDFMYYFSGYFVDAYWSSWLYVVKDYTDKEYTYVLNILTVGLTLFAIVGGLIQRYTHKYKYLQCVGISIRIIGCAVGYYGPAHNNSNAVIVTSRTLISVGGGISVISSQVAAQGSVPHTDMALAMAILSLWTSIGGSIATAIASSVWNRRVPEALTKYVGDQFNATEIAEIFGSINVARVTEPRDLIIKAYNEAATPLFLASLVTSFVSLIFALLTTNFYLGEKHNTIEDFDIKMRSQDETAPEVVAARAREAEEKAAAKLAAQGELHH